MIICFYFVSGKKIEEFILNKDTDFSTVIILKFSWKINYLCKLSIRIFLNCCNFEKNYHMIVNQSLF